MTTAGNGDDPELDAELAALLGPKGGSEGGTRGPAGPLPAGLEKALAAERGPLASLRSRPTRSRTVLAVLLVLATIGGVLALTRRPDLGFIPTSRMLLDVTLLAVPLVAALFVALRPLHRPPLPTWMNAALVVAGTLAVVIVASLPMAHAGHPASIVGAGEDLVRRALACFAFGAAFAATTVVGLRALSRGSGGLWMPTIAVAIGSSLAGALALYFHCPITQPEHLWFGHVTVVVPFVLLAVVLVRRASDG